eukprot:scaffold144707_cov20-Cyclotella_meneghiniana.AAC.1
MPLMFARKTITGSLIGGIKATQEVIDFCNKHDIYPDIKLIKAKELNDAWKALEEGKGDGVRFVVDIKASLEDESFLPNSGAHYDDHSIAANALLIIVERVGQ